MWKKVIYPYIYFQATLTRYVGTTICNTNYNCFGIIQFKLKHIKRLMTLIAFKY